MSTKIYQAWRSTPSDYPELIRRLTDFAYARAGDHFRKFVAPTLKDVPAGVKRVYLSSVGYERRVECVDCHARVFFNRNFAYVIAQSDLNLFGFDPGSPFWDYCYWNNTDKPDDVTRGEWAGRRRVWNALLDRGWECWPVVRVIDGGNYDHVERVVLTAYPRAGRLKCPYTTAFYDAKRVVLKSLTRHVDKHARDVYG